MPDTSELITNGTFDADTDWAKGTGWTITGGKAVATAATGILIQSITNKPLTDDKTYQVMFTVSDYVDGTYRVQLEGMDNRGSGADITANGTYTEIITIDTPTVVSASRFRITTIVDGTAKIDDVSLIELSNPRDVGSGSGWYYRYYNAAAKTKKRKRRARR